ncbi:MAG TPA: hypothetical protein VMS32_08145 [Verrucomicrobiae bacterium]|nr:hypothetical protein [Verrucomicrobiae bacterium]
MQSYSDSIRDGNLPVGILGGLVAAVVAAIVWAAVTAASSYQIGFMAIGVGFLVAYAVRLCGRGHGQAYAISAAILSLLGCALGDFLAGCAMVAKDQHAPIISTVVALAPHFFEVISAGFNFMTVVFYAIGAYFGYRYATIPLRSLPQRITAPGPPVDPSEPDEPAAS